MAAKRKTMARVCLSRAAACHQATNSARATAIPIAVTVAALQDGAAIVGRAPSTAMPAQAAAATGTSGR